MSLANKLYEVGKSITDKEVIESLIRREPDTSIDYHTVAINFTLDNGVICYDDVLNNSCENVFYSEKLGGSATAIYYLYPNLIVRKETLIKVEKDKKGEIKLKGKFSQFIATLENILDSHYANSHNELYLKAILEQITAKEVIEKLQKYAKGDYLYLITINNQSLFEVMPEIWDNWFASPAAPFTDMPTKTFYDYITSREEEIGFNPDIGCYTVNNYNDKLKYRIIDNLPLSKESAKYIKFGWLYAIKNLLFYFDGMQFAILPSYTKQNDQEFKDILSKLRIANEQSQKKRNTLKTIANEESKIKKELDSLEQRKKRDEEKIKDKKEELEEKKNSKLSLKVADGLFTNFKDDIKDLEFIQGLTVDFIFMEINKNEVKIYGSLEEVLPSKVLAIVSEMVKHDISDKITLANKNYEKTHLHDFFHRDELYYYIMNKRKNNPTDTSYRTKILSERFYLAKLLLGDTQIDRNVLYKRFDFHAEYDYEYKKRIDKEGCKAWFNKNNGLQLYRDEQNIFSFFKDSNINKLKD